MAKVNRREMEIARPCNTPPCWDLMEDMVRNFRTNARSLEALSMPACPTSKLCGERVDCTIMPSSPTEREFFRCNLDKRLVSLHNAVTAVSRAYSFLDAAENGDEAKQLIMRVYEGRKNLADAADDIGLDVDTAKRWRWKFFKLVAMSMCKDCYRYEMCRFTRGRG